MRHRCCARYRCCAWLLGMMAGWLAIVAPAAAQQAFDDIVIHELALPKPEMFDGGYVEHRFMVANRSRDHTHVVTLTLPGQTYGQSGIVSRSVTVGPQSQAKVSLWQPFIKINGESALAVSINGRRQTGGLAISMPSPEQWSSHRYRGGISRSLLISQGVDGRFRDELAALTQKTASGYGNGVQALRSSVPVAQWSESWLGYTAYHGVILTEAEWRGLPTSVSQALWAWVQAGGSVLVVGRFTPPAGVTLDDVAMTPSSIRTSGRAVGLGRVGQIPPDRLLGWEEADLQAVDRRYWKPIYDQQVSHRSVSQANQILPVTTSTSIPRRSMLAIMILFALVIGPVNLFFFAWLNRRLWTLVTIPVLALCFSAGVFLYALLAEGIRPSGRAVTWTRLDQTQGQAVTVGWLGYYAPLQPGDGLRFDEHTALIGQNLVDGDYGHDMPDGLAVDWTHGQHLASGWVRARIPSHFHVRKVQLRRERLAIEQGDDGAVQVVNGLGSDLLTLRVADSRGYLHESAAVIPAGQRATLRFMDRKASAANAGLDAQVIAGWTDSPNVFDSAAVKLGDHLAPGTYLGTLREAVFVEPGLAGMKSWETSSVVHGRYLSADGRDSHAD